MKKLLAFVISVCICISSTVMAGAVDDEIYISELRIIYADSYEKAKEKLEDSNFSDYKVLDANLNSGTGETGVWLCYKTTTDIEESITDIAAMYMDGGYQEGNYQAMIEESFAEYTAMSEVYLDAVDYFAMAYEAGDFLAECAYRQFNLYCDNDDHAGERLGDIFLSGIDSPVLATMFMEGNVYALKNIRSLLSQGCAYNESGLTYMETVDEMAALFNEDPEAFEDFENYEKFDAVSLMISAAVLTFGDMMTELSTVEGELNYEDEEDTDTELRYVEYVAIANMLKSVQYTEDKTLYDFCIDYTLDTEDLTSLYPLAAALNDGQEALTQVGHYYDVVRYSMSEYPEELMDSEISALEEKYEKEPFDIYRGVDRSIFSDTYAITSEAYRADAYNESGFEEFFTSPEEALRFKIQVGVLIISTPVFFYSVYRAGKSISASVAAKKAQTAVETLKQKLALAKEAFANTNASHIADSAGLVYRDYDELLGVLLKRYSNNADVAAMSFSQKIDYTLSNMSSFSNVKSEDRYIFSRICEEWNALDENSGIASAQETANKTTKAVCSTASNALTGFLFAASGVLMIWNAISVGSKVINYYWPEYSDVPVALVDMIETEDGDRYIKYDAVLEAIEKGDGKYIPADTNAYEAQRWITLYYTKSYEAGNPLLADFTLSRDNQYAEDGSLAVHLFGNEVCYNLNKYNFESDSDSIYLTVRKSENQKNAVIDVPQVVGSMIGEGYLFLAAGAGMVLGIGATGGALSIKKKMGEKASPESKTKGE